MASSQASLFNQLTRQLKARVTAKRQYLTKCTGFLINTSSQVFEVFALRLCYSVQLNNVLSPRSWIWLIQIWRHYLSFHAFFQLSIQILMGISDTVNKKNRLTLLIFYSDFEDRDQCESILKCPGYSM